MSSTAEDLRERRRARILMSSEERIKKLERMFTKSCDATSEPCDTKNMERQNIEVVPKEITEMEGELVNNCTPNHSEHSHQTQTWTSLPEENDVGVVESDNLTTPDVLDTVLEDDNPTGAPNGVSSSVTMPLFRTLFMLVMGFLVRLAITSSFSSYVQTLVYPFVAIQISIFGVYYTLYSDITGGCILQSGAWISIFQLLGFDRELIDSYGRIMGCVYSVFDDFSCYLFAFVLTHGLLY